MRTYCGILTKNKMASNGVFVFGSNTQGRHGKGAALYARNVFGAEYGKAEGRQNQSYAIITKDLTQKVHPSRPRWMIVRDIKVLYYYASIYYGELFYIPYNVFGRTLNGWTAAEMAEMFALASYGTTIPDNIVFEEKFAKGVQHYKSKEPCPEARSEGQ